MALAQSLTQLQIQTKGKGFTRLNEQIETWLESKDIAQGVLHLTCLHTSCSITINENADPRVLSDLAAWMEAVVPQDGRGPADAQGQRRRYLHDDEGDDDMPAHIRTALTSQTMTLSVQNGRSAAGHLAGGVSLGASPARKHEAGRLPLDRRRTKQSPTNILNACNRNNANSQQSNPAQSAQRNATQSTNSRQDSSRSLG